MDAAVDPRGILAVAAGPAERTALAVEWLSREFRREPELARLLVEEELPLAEAAGELCGAAWLRFYRGWLELDGDDYESALAIFDSVRRSFEALGEAVGVCRAFNALGAAQVSLGAYDLSLDYYRRCVESAEALGRLEIAGGAQVNIADCLCELEEYEEAREAIERSYRDFTLLPQNEPLRDTVAGRTYRALGLVAEAERHLRAAILGSEGVKAQVVDARRALAELYLDQGRLEEAAAAIEGCIELAEAAEERLGAAACRLVRARLSMARGEPGALEDAEAALACACSIGARRLEADAQRVHAEAHRFRGEYAAALEAFELHHKLKESLKNERTRLRIRGLREEQARREAALYRTQLHRISTLSEIGRRVTSSLDLGMIAEAVCGGVGRLMESSAILLDSVGAPPDCALLETATAVGGKLERPVLRAALDPFRQRCLTTRQELAIEDLDIDWPAWAGERPDAGSESRCRSLLQLPLLVGDRVVGLLGVRSPMPGAYGPEQVEALRVIGAYAAIAIENHGLFRRVEELASIDHLTGLQNRRSIMASIEDEFRQYRRYGRPAAVVMLDADRFKAVNDRHGHHSGDAALAFLAGVLRNEARVCDQLGRYGGEEFLLVLPDTDLVGATVCAERYRSALAASRVRLPEGGELRLTASFGVAVFSPGDPGPEAALARADRALYRSKREGRNRVSAEAE